MREKAEEGKREKGGDTEEEETQKQEWHRQSARILMCAVIVSLESL